MITLKDIATSTINAIEAAAKSAGFEVLEHGSSAQSCSQYITIQRRNGDTVQGLAIRISDHSAKSCVTPIDYHVSLGRAFSADSDISFDVAYARHETTEWDEFGDPCDSDFVACDEWDEGAEENGLLVDQNEIQAVAEAVVAAALAAEWENA